MATSFEPKFIEELSDDNICAICSNVLKNPILTECCGQHFCEECLKKWLRKNKTCPHCRTKGFNYIKSLPKKRQIDSMKIYCPNRSKGCEEVMPYSDSQQHLEKCLFVKVECDKKCGEMLLRRDLQDHLSNRCSHREVRCRHCKITGMYKHILNSHSRICHHYPLPCPYRCGQKDIKRKDLRAHKESCPLQPVQCPFSEAGCAGSIHRKDLDAHINSSTQYHLALVMKSMSSVQQNETTLQQNVETLEQKVATLQQKVEILQQKVETLQQNETTLQQKVATVQQNFATLISCVSRELDSISLSQENIRAVHCIKTTLVSVTTMLEKDKWYCLRMVWSILKRDYGHGESDAFYAKPGYKLNIATFKIECTQQFNLKLRRGENDDKVQWPMESMDLILNDEHHKRIGKFSLCPICSGYNLNRLSTNDEQRMVEQIDLKSQLLSKLSYLYIKMTHHYCIPQLD